MLNPFDYLKAGAPVSLVWYDEGQPQSSIGTCSTCEPLTIEVAEETHVPTAPGSRIKLLFMHNGSFESVDAKLETLSVFNHRKRMVFGAAEWERSDRRSSTRYNLKLLAKCRMISDGSDGAQLGEFNLVTNDVSRGGAWIQSDVSVQVGAVLSCEISTGPDQIVKALGIVAWCDPNGTGFGVEFLDFIGQSKVNWIEFLKKQAA